jgi:alcohol dehydrogenase, propanol-preferring
MGSAVPATAPLSEGDMVVVNPSWGDGICRQFREGNEQLCSGDGRWVGFGPPGGFAEYLAVQYRHAIPVSGAGAQTPEILAPMTDAGATPYRGLKKLRDAGKLGPGRTVAVNGIGGLGAYAVQYARLFAGGSTVIALGRSDSKLAVAVENGAHHGINTRGQVRRGHSGRARQTQRPAHDRRDPGLCGRHGICLLGVRPAGRRGCPGVRRADERPR